MIGDQGDLGAGPRGGADDVPERAGPVADSQRQHDVACVDRSKFLRHRKSANGNRANIGPQFDQQGLRKMGWGVIVAEPDPSQLAGISKHFD